MLKITLIGDTPSKKNSRILSWKGKRPFSFPSKNYRNWQEEKSWELYQIKKDSQCPFKKCEVEIIFYPSSKRKADLTNKAESVLDLLVDNNIIKDDNWFVVESIGLRIGERDKENPRCEILIK